MPTIQLYSIPQGKLVDFDLAQDRNGDIVASYGKGDSLEQIKFPGGVSRKDFLEQIEAYNQANKDVSPDAVSQAQADNDLRQANDDLLSSL